MTHPTAADHSGTAPDTASTPPDAVHGAPPSQFALLRQRRFAPFFWTQFLGAGNDNLFKFALTVLLTYQLQVDWLPPAMAGLVIGALFILPFVLLSATSGQLSDKYPKELVMRFVKTLEIAIMALAAWGFSRQDVPILLGCVFLMGVHSTLFGPVKFAYLPQHLSERELTGGNGMVEMGTFVSILLGNLVGGLLIALPDVGRSAVAVSCLAVAVAGRLAAQAIPPFARTRSPAQDRMEPPGRNLAQPPPGARQPGGVPLAAGHQLDVVLRRGFPGQLPGLCQGGAARRRARGLRAADGVLAGHRHRLADVRDAVQAPCGDRPGARRRDRHDGVCGGPVLRLQQPAGACRPVMGLGASWPTPGTGG
jgi:hypothetical protein